MTEEEVWIKFTLTAMQTESPPEGLTHGPHCFDYYASVGDAMVKRWKRRFLKEKIP